MPPLISMRPFPVLWGLLDTERQLSASGLFSGNREEGRGKLCIPVKVKKWIDRIDYKSNVHTKCCYSLPPRHETIFQDPQSLHLTLLMDLYEVLWNPWLGVFVLRDRASWLLPFQWKQRWENHVIPLHEGHTGEMDGMNTIDIHYWIQFLDFSLFSVFLSFVTFNPLTCHGWTSMC